MNEELKKYVTAYIDGEEVEWRYEEAKAVYDWHTISKLSDFEMSSAYINFRIKPKAEDKWQRVIDEKFLCKFWDAIKEDSVIGKLHKDSLKHDKFKINNEYGKWYDNCEVLREKGHKQPHFQGDDIPKIDGQIVVYFKSGVVDMMYADVLAWDWSEVVAYMEV